MQTLHLETICSEAGVIILRDLPIKVGDAFEVVVIPWSSAESNQNQYPLRGEPLDYLEPFDPAVENDWEAAQ